AGGADCGIELWHAAGIKVRHNSIWRPERNWGRGIRLGAGVVQTEVVNNLVHGGIQIEGGEVNSHHNLARQIDGYFVDPSIGDLSLTAAATGAIGQGVILNDAPYDVRGLPRKKVPDLGAWEFGAKVLEQDPRMVAPPNAVRGRLPDIAPTPARDAAKTFRLLDG